MYFQKLEPLYRAKEYNTLLLDAIDSWLAYVPKSYRDRLMPEMFQVDQDIELGECYKLFDKLNDYKILKERFYIECECGYVNSFCESFFEVTEKIKAYNEAQEECLDCEEVKMLSTDNVYVTYRLIEKPAIIERKKKVLEATANSSYAPSNLSIMIEENPQKYISEVGIDDLYKVAGSGVRRGIQALKRN